MKKIAVAAILVLAILLGIITRFYKLGEAPAGLYLDEAAQGYSAYSILKTGKDEFGKPFPIVFRSFTDFKTPVYIYMLVPLIPIFDLTKFTVRLPSFIFSILTLPLIYLLLKEIAPKKLAKSLSLTTALLLAISPWHVLFGRTNFECNVALFFFLAGVYFFYRGLKKPANLLVSAFMFAIAIPAYHAQRIVTPLIMLVLFIKHRKRLLDLKSRPFLFLGIAVGFLISLPTLSVTFTPGFLARASGLNIFS
ncbi:MAG: glycosyltransferase family 39 protein, partial [Microgenomates group bacterium]